MSLHPKVGDLIKKVTNEEGPYCGNTVSDILADCRINSVENRENGFDIVVKAAKNPFLWYPYFAFQKICLGM